MKDYFSKSTSRRYFPGQTIASTLLYYFSARVLDPFILLWQFPFKLSLVFIHLKFSHERTPIWYSPFNIISSILSSPLFPCLTNQAWMWPTISLTTVLITEKAKQRIWAQHFPLIPVNTSFCLNFNSQWPLVTPLVNIPASFLLSHKSSIINRFQHWCPR